MPLERYQMCGHILAQRMRELLSAAPLFITENGASWLLQHAEPPAEFVYAHSSAFTPASESERGLFLLPSAPGITPVSSAWRRIQGSAQQFVSSAAYGLGRGGATGDWRSNRCGNVLGRRNWTPICGLEASWEGRTGAVWVRSPFTTSYPASVPVPSLRRSFQGPSELAPGARTSFNVGPLVPGARERANERNRLQILWLYEDIQLLSLGVLYPK